MNEYKCYLRGLKKETSETIKAVDSFTARHEKALKHMGSYASDVVVIRIWEDE